MKITINLTESEVKGLKEYIKETDCLDKVTKQDIKSEMQNIISCNLQAGAVRDYISKYEN